MLLHFWFYRYVPKSEKTSTATGATTATATGAAATASDDDAAIRHTAASHYSKFW